MAAVELERVSFGYRPGQRVLEDVDLRIAEGEFVAIAGPNGGGKTTLVRIVLGLERPSGGRALLYGEPAHRFSRQIRDGRVFYVYPDPTVCVCLYVGDQNAYATYRKNMFDKQLADEQQMTAQEMEMNSWDWGPWGGWPYGWYY